MKTAALLVILCASLAAQPASVEGTVVNRTNGQPMSGVHVRLILGESTDSPEVYGATSDEAGRFSFPQLKPGSYLTLVDRVGFFQMQPKGAKTAGVYTTVKAGERLTDLKLEMAEHAVITGRVLDDNGDPPQNGYVQLMPVSPDTAVQPLVRHPSLRMPMAGIAWLPRPGSTTSWRPRSTWGWAAPRRSAPTALPR
jgi:5-hydroxyisourate hydrolase-like protein (transthyretin family)